jgi:microcystin-dependent protein
VAQPYVGEIRIFCEGQLLPIAEYETLFQLIGTTYGGDGQENFALPDLRGRIPLHQGNGKILAEQAGTETVTLTQQQMPVHTHPMVGANTAGNQVSPIGNLPANSTSVKPYIAEDQDGNFANAAVTPEGGSQPHDNFMPYLCVDFIISLFGIFPSPT